MPSIDSLKLLFLVALTFASLSTLFTSQSIVMQNPSMRILTATATRGGEGGGNTQQQRFCMTPRRNVMKNCDRKLKKGTATTVHNNSTLNSNNSKNAIHSEEEEEQQQQQCDTYRNNVQKCQKIVKRAFRDINMKGCPKQIKLVTLCEDEWCSGHYTTGTYIGNHNHNHQTSTSCQKECAGVQDSLELCIKQRIMIVFKQNGLNEDGTTTTMTK